jgi:DNA-binding transcriptional ArsR family regulator
VPGHHPGRGQGVRRRRGHPTRQLTLGLPFRVGLRKYRLTYVATYRGVDLGILGDPTRRAIFELLARRPCSVGELADHLPITRQAVSQHLRVLRNGGLVVATPEGTRRIYRLNPDGVAALRAYFERIWDDALTAFQKAADAAASKPEQEQHR